MPRRRLPLLSPEGRAMFERDLLAAAERERQAALDKYVLVAAAYAAGMTTREIGAVLDVTSGTASRWKEAGEEQGRRRFGGREAAE